MTSKSNSRIPQPRQTSNSQRAAAAAAATITQTQVPSSSLGQEIDEQYSTPAAQSPRELPPHMNNDNIPEGSPMEENNSVEFAGEIETDNMFDHLDDLTEIGLAVEVKEGSRDLIGHYELEISPPGLMSASEIHKLTPKLAVYAQDRFQRAVGHGQKALNCLPTGLNEWDFFKSTYCKAFSREVQYMKEMFTHVERYQHGFRFAWRLRKDLLVRCLRALAERRLQAREDFLLAGIRVPPVPTWAFDGEVNEFREANDFEIFSATFRREAESFLFALQEVHDFGVRTTTSKDKGKGRTVNSPTLSNKGRLTPSHKEYPKPTRTRWLEPFQYPSSVPINESISGYQARDASDRIKATIGAGAAMFTNPSTYFSSRRVKEMFDDGYTEENQRSEHQDNRLNNARRPSERNEQEKMESSDNNSRPTPRGLEPPDGPDPDPSDDDNDGSDGRRGNDGGGRRPGRGNRIPNDLRRNLGGDPDPPRGPGGPNGPNGPGGPNGPNGPGGDGQNRLPYEPQFDIKLKPDAIPEWDGDTETLYRWILKMNTLSERSHTVWKQLGQLTPSRLKGNAETWYYSQSRNTRRQMETNWKTLRTGISNYFMNRSWMERQKSRANRATYRDAGNRNETPSDYYIRKFELVSFAYNLNDYEMIREIMNGAPSYWTNILTAHLYTNLEDFQTAIKFHEDSLLKLDSYRRWDYAPSREFQT